MTEMLKKTIFSKNIFKIILYTIYKNSRHTASQSEKHLTNVKNSLNNSSKSSFTKDFCQNNYSIIL